MKLNNSLRYIYSNLSLYSIILKLISMLVIQTVWDGAMKIVYLGCYSGKGLVGGDWFHLLLF